MASNFYKIPFRAGFFAISLTKRALLSTNAFYPYRIRVCADCPYRRARDNPYYYLHAEIFYAQQHVRQTSIYTKTLQNA